MNRIAAIKSLIAIASALEERGMIAEASVLDEVMKKIASIENEGGLQGNYPISPNLMNDLGEYDPYSLNQLADEHSNLSPGYERAEQMVDGLVDRFQENNIYDEENPEEIDPDEKEMRDLALRWSSGPGSALYGFAYTGMVYSLDQRRELIKELEDAVEFNNDPEEHIRLQGLKNVALSSVPIMTNDGLESVDKIHRELTPNPSGGFTLAFMFTTFNGKEGFVEVEKTKDGKWQFNEAAWVEDFEIKPWDWSTDQIASLAEALSQKTTLNMNFSGGLQ